MKHLDCLCSLKRFEVKVLRDALFECRDLSFVEVQLKKKDGDVRTFLWNSANIYDPEGNLHSVVAHVCFKI